MKNVRILLFILPLLIFAVCSAGNPVKDSKTAFAAERFQPLIDSGEYPGMISILYRNGIQETACLGWAHVEKKIPMSMDLMFMQCSQTKGLCGVTVAMLVEEGRISLDDPVGKYLPELKNMMVKTKDSSGKEIIVPAKNVLTIRMVMNHTGGFPFEVPTKSKKGWPALSLQDTAKEAAAQPLLFEPGTGEKYSNTGIDIGAAVVEKVTGQKWDEFVRERVFEPLGMKDSTFNPTDEQLARRIYLYRIKKGQKAQFVEFFSAMPLPHNGKNIHPSAGAGLWTTASDQYKFYKMLMNLGVGDNGVRILKEETVKNLLATSTRPEKLGGYSLGLAVGKDGSMGHGGAWGSLCLVNWKKKELRLLVIQGSGTGVVRGEWSKMCEKFFSAKDLSGVNDYTGRMQ